MNRRQSILNMQQILLKRREALRRALAGDLSLLKEIKTEAGGDIVDFALDSVQDEISSKLAELESRELLRVEKALQRMEEGQYGICEGCGCSIPLARLTALPYATLCIKCQREAELEDRDDDVRDVDWSRLSDSSGSDAELTINDIELDVS
ncbi:MAG: TraR/DksA family transcriptional regulator [Thermogutta sp.]|nr:TraR/DksA family transcriptional regulator [Thermogutta sp.]